MTDGTKLVLFSETLTARRGVAAPLLDTTNCELGRRRIGSEFDQVDPSTATEVLVNPALNKPEGDADAFRIQVSVPEGAGAAGVLERLSLPQSKPLALLL